MNKKTTIGIILFIASALLAIVVFGYFSNRQREMLGGATEELEGGSKDQSDRTVDLMRSL